MIFDVHDKPGRISSGGLSSAITTLKSFASWLDTALCDAAKPVERRIAVLPISITVPLNVLFGIASIVMSAGWPSFTLTMSVSSTFTSAVMTDISAIVMMVLAAEFCTPGTTVSPTRTGRFVTTPSIGAVALCFASMSSTRA